MPVWFLFGLTFAGEPLPAVDDVDSPNLRTDVVEFADQALSTSRNLFEVVMRPLRDSPQLLPWNDAPIEPAPEAAKAKALGGNLFVLGDTPEAKAFWKWRVEGGGNFRQGNTTTNNVNAVFNAERRSAVSAFLGRFGATYNQVDGNGQDNRRFFGDATYDRHWRGRWICYSRQELENDQARRIDVRSISSTGLGYRFLDEPTIRWVMRSGPSYTFLRQHPADGPSRSTSQGGWLIESEFRKQLGEASRFEWTHTLYPNFAVAQTFRMRNEVALLFPTGGAKSLWNWKIGMRHEYTESPPNGTQPADTEVYFAIVYSNK